MLKFFVVLLTTALVLKGQSVGVSATAQCESIRSNVLGIKNLATCDIGVTNYSSGTVIITEAMIRQWFPTLEIENAARAQAVADKAFNNSKKSRAIAALNFVSPFAVALLGGGLIGMSARIALRATAATSLGNTAAQSFKGYLIGQQPNEAAFLPTLPPAITLAPYGTMANGLPSFSGVWTVLGSISYTNGVSKKRAKLSPAPVLTWQGNLPPIPLKTIEACEPTKSSSLVIPWIGLEMMGF
jgi:hypothetical protein